MPGEAGYLRLSFSISVFGHVSKPRQPAAVIAAQAAIFLQPMTQPRAPRLLSTLWIVATVAASAVGIFSLRYALPHPPYPARLPNVTTHREALIIHATMASFALLSGPLQMSRTLRNRFPNVHRGIGWLYVTAVLVGWIASLPLALHAFTGAIASAGFLCLGAAWLFTTLYAIVAISGGDIKSHRNWMIRGYALTFAAVTLRIYLGLSIAAGALFVAYPFIAWACWLPNLAVAEWLIISRSKLSKP